MQRRRFPQRIYNTPQSPSLCRLNIIYDLEMGLKI